MNRLTAIGLASLVAYGVLIASKYTGVVSAAPEEAASQQAAQEPRERVAGVSPLVSDPAPKPLSSLPAPVPRAEPSKMSQVALEFRSARDLKAFAEGLSARRAELTGDERYHLAKALE